MIDTIELRIHNFDSYKKNYAQLLKHSADGITETYISQDTGEVLEDYKVRALVYHDNNGFVRLSHRNSIFIASSHYSLSYFLNLQENTLDLNFSVPKFLYSTNVLQFVDYYDQSPAFTFKKLFLFLTDFFTNYFIERINLKDVQVKRIDFCYNQFFLSKEQALQYLDYQKELLVKYARSSKNNYRSYDTSLMYVTQRYSFKIYHKGTEFKKHDYKELVKNNNPLNIDLDYFLEKSELILRYEMSFRNSYLNYIFNQMYFTSEKKLQDYPAVLSSHTYSVLVNFSRAGYRKVFDYLRDKTKSFCLQSPYDSKSMNLNDYKDSLNFSFDAILFTALYDVFISRVKAFQVNQKLSFEQIKERIKEGNNKVKMKNSLRTAKESEKTESRLIILAMLSQYVNIEELRTQDLIPRATFYRIKSDLKKIGLGDFNVNEDIPPPRLDYLDYKMYFSKYH